MSNDEKLEELWVSLREANRELTEAQNKQRDARVAYLKFHGELCGLDDPPLAVKRLKSMRDFAARYFDEHGKVK